MADEVVPAASGSTLTPSPPQHLPQVRQQPRRRTCRICNQHHLANEPHLYDYIDEVDEDVSCHICLQPLVTPVDTPCGHTFCKPCLMTYLKCQPQCPVDRRPLTHQLCTPSSLVLRKLLEKLIVKCPNTSKCEITLQRGDLEDHLKYRCPGNWVCCPYSISGCDVKGPQKTVVAHAAICPNKDAAASRDKPAVKEGEVSHVEIARSQTALGITIVGGADTPLRCIVIQEIFPDGLIAQDGRLQSGDQIIEIDGVDMTSASHSHVCQELKKFTQPTLRLGIYRERIHNPPVPLHGSPNINTEASNTSLNATLEHHTITLWRESGRQLGIKLGGRHTQAGIFILEILPNSVAANDGRLKAHDRILAINGHDVRYARLDFASRLIQRSGTTTVSLVITHSPQGTNDYLFQHSQSSVDVVHSRTKSAPEPLLERLDLSIKEFNKSSDDMVDGYNICGIPEDGSRSLESLSNQPENIGHSTNAFSSQRYKSNGSIGSLNGNDNSQLYQSNGSLGSIGSPFNKSSISGTPNSLRPSQVDSPKSDSFNAPTLPPRSRIPLGRAPSNDRLVEENSQSEENLFDGGRSSEDVVDGQTSSRVKPRRSKDSSDLNDLACGFRRSLKLDGQQLHQKTVTISKPSNESLGMRIGGGVSSNEGDTPIYIANINPNGPVGKSSNVKKGDVLLSVNGQSLLGLTHGQAVAQLKATAELAGVVLSLLDGPESSSCSVSNFVPSWLYWQKLPRPLQISRSVVLQRAPGSSLGFSIVGGADPSRGPEPIHVLLVVALSPAAIDGKLRCGDRILAVDNFSLENVSHSTAVGLLKQAGQRVHLEVVSWLGTEL